MNRHQYRGNDKVILRHFEFQISVQYASEDALWETGNLRDEFIYPLHMAQCLLQANTGPEASWH